MDLGRLLVQPDASIGRLDRAGLANRLAVVDEQVMHIAEADHNNLRSKAVRQVIETELLAFLSEHNEELLDRVGEALMGEAHGDFDLARQQAKDGLDDVHHLLVNHSEAIR